MVIRLAHFSSRVNNIRAKLRVVVIFTLDSRWKATVVARFHPKKPGKGNVKDIDGGRKEAHARLEREKGRALGSTTEK